MSKPVVAIVGRPNVGKSCLFNRILKEKHAVVDDIAGVTRDRNYRETAWDSIPFVLADTGGLIPGSHEPIAVEIREQVQFAIDESDVIIFIVDAIAGATEADLIIARQLRKEAADRVLLVANKAEGQNFLNEYDRFMSLGCGEPLAVSALHGTGVGTMLDRVTGLLKKNRDGEIRAQGLEEIVNIAILGRPNAGKSSIVNRLLGKKRMIVDAVPGTTRDAVDSIMKYNGLRFRLIDTAGLRRKSQVKENLEHYTNLRAVASIERSDVSILVVDSADGFSEQDAKILSLIQKFRKGAVLCLNKWDLVEKDHRSFDILTAQLRGTFAELKHLPIVSTSALTGLRMTTLIETVIRIKKNMATRVPSADFKDDIHGWARLKPHPLIRNKEIRILGAKQVAAPFPLFHIFASNAELAALPYTRYLANNIYDKYGFLGCPVIIIFKPPARPMAKRVSRESVSA